MPSYANIHRSSHSWMLNHVWCLAPGPGPHSSCQLPRVMARLARQVDVSAIQIYHDQVPWRAACGSFSCKMRKEVQWSDKGMLSGGHPNMFFIILHPGIFPRKKYDKMSRIYGDPSHTSHRSHAENHANARWTTCYQQKGSPLTQWLLMATASALGLFFAEFLAQWMGTEMGI